MKIPGFRFKEIDFDKVPGLTWYDLTNAEFDTLEEKDKLSLPCGALLRTADGFVYVVGDARADGWDTGCGCCSDSIKFTQVAFLSELLGGLL